MVSSDGEEECGNKTGIKRRRSRSGSSNNRTLTSTSSSNDVQSDIYDDSRSSSPELFQQQQQQQHQIPTQNEEKKIKIKHQQHSTPLIEQQQQYKKLHVFNSPTPTAQMLSALQYVHSIIPTEQQRPPQQQLKPLSLCAVCGDRASGKHYGVLSCDGCRGFFKRSIRGNMEYVCKENQKCIIDVSRRNQCQACRLKKCLEVKMNRDGMCLASVLFTFSFKSYL